MIYSSWWIYLFRHRSNIYF